MHSEKIQSDSYNNKTVTEFTATPMEDPFFINLTIKRTVDGQSPHDYPKIMIMDIMYAQELVNELSGAIDASKNTIEQNRDIAYEGWKAVEDELISQNPSPLSGGGQDD